VHRYRMKPIRTLRRSMRTSRVGKQAHRDLQRGMKDTDRRGGDEYQQKTQNDAHSNENSSGKAQREPRGKH
jgi:hypothetical protein